MAAIRTPLFTLLTLLATSTAQAEVIYSAEEEDGSVTFTHYRNRDCLEVFLDDEMASRPASMAVIDPETVYRNLDAFDDLILDAAARHQLSPALVKAMVLVESGFNSRALSPKGAQGLMQLMPGTAAEVGVSDPLDPGQNIDGGCAYLRRMIDRFGGNRDKAIAAYNAGPAAVERHGGTPPYEETRFYVTNVNKFYDYFSNERPVRRSP